MQKQMGGDASSHESCQVKVNVEFINHFGSGASNNQNESILDQFPDEKEYLEQVCENMPSEGAANHEREQKVKYLTNGVVV
jgi:hypothetical protein